MLLTLAGANLIDCKILDYVIAVIHVRNDPTSLALCVYVVRTEKYADMITF